MKYMKYRIYLVSPEMLVQFLTNGRRSVTIYGIPQGAKYISAHHDFRSDCFYLKVEHESFEPVPEGGLLRQDFIGVHDIILEEKPENA